MKATLHTDGACLGNPGPMGLGIVLRQGSEVFEKSIPFGKGTNNIAEYSALIEGLKLAVDKNISSIDVFLDSLLVVNQVNGEWRVKDATLQQLHREANNLKQLFSDFSISHVRREQNAHADELSKLAAEKVK